MQNIPIAIDAINEKIQQQRLLCEMRSYLPSHRQFTPLYFLTAFLPDKSSPHRLLEHTTEQKTPEPEVNQLIDTMAPSEKLITPTTPVDKCTPAVTSTSVYTNITSAGSSTSQMTALPESNTPTLPISAKRSLDDQFDQESKHQKIT